MRLDPAPAQEQARLDALHDYAIVDTADEPVFDAVTRLAASICQVPIALISLVTEDRQWFKSRVGLDARETPRELAFCAHAIAHTQIMEVPDALRDPRFVNNPLVTDAPRIRFYAGSPLMTHDGYALGTLCVIDREPRALTAEQRDALEQLSIVTMQLLSTRRTARRNEKLGRLMEQSTDEIFVVDTAQQRVVDANAAALRNLQLSLSELMRLPPQEIIEAFDPRRWSATIAQAQSHTAREHAFSANLRRRDGSLYPVEGKTQLWSDEGRVFALLVVRDVTRRRAVEAALRDSERRLRAVTDNLPARIAYIDRDQRYRFANAQIERALNLDAVELLGRSLRDVRGEKAYAVLRPHVLAALAGKIETFEEHDDSDGESCHFQASYIPDIDSSGEVLGFYAMSFDITGRKQAELRQALSEERLRLITDNVPALISYIDVHERYGFNNARYAAWLQRPLERITGQTVADVHDAQTYALVAEPIRRALAGERVEFDLEMRLGDEPRHVRGTYIPHRDSSDHVVGVYGLIHDVSAMKAIERRLRVLAEVDSLTGLMNRSRFNEFLLEASARTDAAGTPLAVLFLDVDHFKAINDAMGHHSGDEVLREFARRLSHVVADAGTVARLAGDEFVIVLDALPERAAAVRIASAIVQAMQPAMRLGTDLRRVSCSVGVAWRNDTTEEIEALLRRADQALYAAKAAGRDGYAVAE